MASSSSLRFAKGTKSFQTCIYPNECEIQLCPRFKNAWIKQLRKIFLGSLLHEDDDPIKVALFLDNNDCYITNGRHVSKYLGFQEPAKVILTYEIFENCFRVSVIKNEAHHNVSDNSKANKDDPVFGRLNGACYIDGCALPGFINDRVFSWELPVSKAYASSTKEQVLHIPQDTFKRILRNRTSVLIRTPHNGDGIRCDLITYERKKGKEEMYIGRGWFEFVRANNFNNFMKGDKLRFQLCDPPNVLVVDIVRRTT